MSTDKISESALIDLLLATHVSGDEELTAEELSELLRTAALTPRKQALLDRINRSPEAYELWVSLVRAREQALLTPKPDLTGASISQRLYKAATRWLVQPAIGAVAAVVAVILIFPPFGGEEPTLDGRLSLITDVDYMTGSKGAAGAIFSAPAEPITCPFTRLPADMIFRQMLRAQFIRILARVGDAQFASVLPGDALDVVLCDSQITLDDLLELSDVAEAIGSGLALRWLECHSEQAVGEIEHLGDSVFRHERKALKGYELGFLSSLVAKGDACDTMDMAVGQVLILGKVIED